MLDWERGGGRQHCRSFYEPRMFFSVRDLLGNADDVANPRFGPYEVSYVSPAGEAFTGECE